MFFAFLGALAIGVSLGLLGSGGSVLTLPVLLFMLHRPDKLAIAESLAIIGVVAGIGSLPYLLRRQIDFRNVIFFGIAGMVGAYSGACASRFVSGSFQVSLFAVMMLVASWMMLFGPKLNQEPTADAPPRQVFKLIRDGFFVGLLTGLIGVGGGFLIVPALVLLGSLSIHLAIGTSLVIIAMNSLTGFLEQLVVLSAQQQYVSWMTIGLFALVGIVGSFAGSAVGYRFSQAQMRRLFGVFIFGMGLFILFRQL